MRNIVSIVLGGGKGTRLYPLTHYRSKPAVPLAGKYRIIDVPISNCLNSGMMQIYLLTQFNSVSLHRHIRESYVFDRFSGGFVEILAAQQTPDDSGHWYEGTADAVRKNLRYFEQPGIDYVLILSGDQLYRMDYREMLKTHQDSGADATIATVPVTAEQARAFGILRFDETGRVVGFLEKPQTKAELDLVRTDPAWIDNHGIESQGRDCLASMGIYLFNRQCLLDLLQKTDYQDFGKEIFPASIRTHKVQVHLFDGYWEDIGTIRSFYDANLALASREAPFRFIKDQAPIYTRARYLPPTRMDSAKVERSLIADGCLLEPGCEIYNSVVGLRCQIGPKVHIKNTILMGADYYQKPGDDPKSSALAPPGSIGDNTELEGVIVDKNCRIGSNVKIKPIADTPKDTEIGPVIIRDGIVVVPKGSVIPDGWDLNQP